MGDLHIAEIPFESGQVQFRYARYLADDGQRWIRHGLFQAFHESGALASEGAYKHGLEECVWRDYHPNGRLAAEGQYQDGVKVGQWRFWDADGRQEESESY